MPGRRLNPKVESAVAAGSPGLAKALIRKHPGFASAQSLPELLHQAIQGSAEKAERPERGGGGAGEEKETPSSRLARPSGASGAWGPRGRGLRDQSGRRGLVGAETHGASTSEAGRGS